MIGTKLENSIHHGIYKKANKLLMKLTHGF